MKLVRIVCFHILMQNQYIFSAIARWQVFPYYSVILLQIAKRESSNGPRLHLHCLSTMVIVDGKT
jgi:hypothetical protein